MKKIFILMALLISCQCHASVIFQDNFDSTPDWRPHPVDNAASGDIECDYGGTCNPLPPNGWDYYRSTGQWWEPLYHDTIRISTPPDGGGNGKAFIVYNESYSTGWDSDGQLTKLLPTDYQEIYIRAKIRTQSGWRWSATADMFIKMLRCMHFDRTGSVFSFFSGGNSCPIYVFDFLHSNTYGTRGSDTFRGDPQESWYYMDGLDHNWLFNAGDTSIEPTGAGMLADGSEHTIILRLKMNTYGSAWNSDGVCQIWYDGNLKQSYSNILWKTTGSDPTIGWNMVAIGGNCSNYFADTTTKSEQWYSIDDVVIATTYNDAVVGASSTATCTILTASGQTVTNPSFTINGTANTTSGSITSVTSPGLTVTGTNSWSTTVTLLSGLNTFTFTAIDSNGSSGTATITVTYTPQGGGVSAASFLGDTFAGEILQ